ncbi:hypothetical protein PVAND_012965 [Polypedilum vanderplanki]|uniref:Alkaline phosphatase n=1 Tax=Polypedilum vanderplanki TaxID=319348 RepID=A0A9J6CQ08_POLVA|nr:hypothetical protein PVAND_012965 [Polypedilum vanderplanki]
MTGKILIFFIILIVQILSSPTSYDEGEFEFLESKMHPPFSARAARDAMQNSAISPDELTREYWLNQAKATIAERLTLKKNNRKAKNIIVFLGDGMSHATLAAARNVLGNENKNLSFEHFPYTASSKTYCVNAQVPDSACTATAIFSGVKNNINMVGLTAAAKYDSCSDQNNSSMRAYSIAKWFQDQHKSAGFVTTTSVTHATPACVYAKAANRDWEGNQRVRESGCDDTIVDDIAEQLIHGDIGSKLKVALGGGSRFFVNTSTIMHNTYGARTDGKNLINEWLSAKPNRKFVKNREELMSVNTNNIDSLFGLFESYFMQFNLDVVHNNWESIYPTLTEMAVKAVDVLSKDKNGYFLLVEGGRIDHGHHFTQSRYAVDELIEFHKAIETIKNKVNLDETLIVVTGDHGHTLSFGGWPKRGNDVFGVTKGSFGPALDGNDYFSLSYANGPGYYTHRKAGARVDPKTLDTTGIGFNFPATVPAYVETHSGDDIGVWAVGPQSHEFRGVIEQNVIAHLMAKAACVGAYNEDCQN